MADSTTSTHRCSEHQFSRSYVQYNTQNGYKLEINPLPPYYLDFIDAMYPLKEYPMRMHRNEAGDVFGFPYEPPDKPIAEDHKDYDLYVTWLAVDYHNTKMETLRKKARPDFLLATCVDVLDGRYSIDDTEWEGRLQEVFGSDYHLPHGKVGRLLPFLKSEVIRTQLDKDMIIQSAMYPEVEMQGIANALHMFQDTLG